MSFDVLGAGTRAPLDFPDRTSPTVSRRYVIVEPLMAIFVDYMKNSLI